jgi:hypothetical protein
LRAHHGQPATISGMERNGHGGPEVILPLPGELPDMALVVARPVELGARVRITRPPYLGAIGQVVALPTMPQETVIGTRAEGAEVRLPDGRRVFVPSVNMELLG